MNQNLGNVVFFSNITIIYLLTIRILPKRTFCCWLINDVNVLLAIQSWLKDFCCLTNDDRKTNAKWTGSSSGETLFQRFKPFNHVSCFCGRSRFSLCAVTTYGSWKNIPSKLLHQGWVGHFGTAKTISLWSMQILWEVWRIKLKRGSK